MIDVAQLSRKFAHSFPFYRRAMVISKNEVFGNWEVDWQLSWDEMREQPKLTEKGLRFELKVC